MNDNDLLRRGDAVKALSASILLPRKKNCFTDSYMPGERAIIRALPATIPEADDYVHITYDGAAGWDSRYAATIEVTVPTLRGDQHIKLGATGATRSDVLRSLADALEDHDV